MDYHISDKDSLFGSLSWSNTGKHRAARRSRGRSTGRRSTARGETDLARNAQMSYTRVWKPKLISETRVGFTRLVTSRIGGNPGTDLFTQFGIGGYNPTTAHGQQRRTAADRLQQRLSADRRQRLDSHQGIQQRLGLHPERRGQQGLARAQVRRRVPADQVPVLPGARSARKHRLQPESDGVPVDRQGTTGAAINTVTGDPIASALLGQIDSGNISTTNFVSSQKSPPGRGTRRTTGR